MMQCIGFAVAAFVLFLSVPARAAAPVVIVCQAVERNSEHVDTFAGRLEASATVELRARQSGVLEQVHFKEGSAVKKGDLLFSLDSRPLQARLVKAEAELAASKARLDAADNDFKRTEALVRNNAITREALDKMAAQRTEMQSLVQVAKAQLEAARAELEASRIIAPIDGHIGRSFVSPGATIGDGILATITRSDPLHVYFQLPERDLRRYRDLLDGRRPDALAVEVRTEADEGIHRGTLDFVDNRIDPNSGTLTLRGVVPNADGKLLPGMFARVNIRHGETKVLHVPEGAVRSDANGSFVFIVGEKNAAERRAVQAGPASGGLRPIRSGLKGGEWVVVGGPRELKNGEAVESWPVTPPERNRKD